MKDKAIFFALYMIFGNRNFNDEKLLNIHFSGQIIEMTEPTEITC